MKKQPGGKHFNSLFLKGLRGVITILFLVAIGGCGRGGEEGTEAQGEATDNPLAGVETATEPGGEMGMGSGGGMMGMGSGGGMMGMGSGMGTGQAGGQVPAEVEVVKLPPMVPSRSDPFKPLVPPPPPPSSPPVIEIPKPPPLPSRPLVIRPAAVVPPPPPPPPPGPPPAPAQTRMAGVLWGDDVLGILVHQGQGFVVRPGDLIKINTGNQPGDYIVVSITTEAMFIRPAYDETASVMRVPLRNIRGMQMGEIPPTPGEESATPGPEEAGAAEAEENNESLPGVRL